MEKLKFGVLTGVCLAAGALLAVPVVPDASVSLAQDARGAVVVGYTLQNEAAVITVGFQTNGVSLGPAISLSGDVNVKVEPGARTFKWLPAKDIGGNVILADIRAVVSVWATNAPPPYMAVHLESTAAPFYYASAEEVPGGVTHEKYKKRWLLMRKIPAANVWWRMGAGQAELGQYGEYKVKEAPHMVQLSSDYYIGVYPVTQRQYSNVIGSVPSGQKYATDYPDDIETCPVNKVSWQMLRGADAVWPNATHAHTVDVGSAIETFRTRTGIDSLDLPTDAQWEYAGRAGVADGLLNGTNVATSGSIPWNSPIPLGDSGWTNGNGSGAPHPVGLLLPNRWGLYDMAGNVEEWCLDWYENVGTTTDQVDPEGPASSTVSLRVVRGLGYNNGWQLARCASSRGVEPGSGDVANGFRLICDAVAK